MACAYESSDEVPGRDEVELAEARCLNALCETGGEKQVAPSGLCLSCWREQASSLVDEWIERLKAEGRLDDQAERLLAEVSEEVRFAWTAEHTPPLLQIARGPVMLTHDQWRAVSSVVLGAGGALAEARAVVEQVALTVARGGGL